MIHTLCRAMFALALLLAAATLLAVGDAKPAEKQDSGAKPAEKAPEKAAPSDAKAPATPPTAEDIEKKLKDRLNNPPAKPSTDAKPADPAKAGEPGKPAGEVKPDDKKPALPAAAPTRVDQPDPRIIGIAPGSATPKLRREGEFVLNRRGRLVREGGQSLFAFDADTDKAAEAPMMLVPCRVLQNMEELAQEHGSDVVFLVTGQVFTYRGANHLLPTTMKLSIDKGNLKK